MRSTLSCLAVAAVFASGAAYADPLPSANFDAFSLQYVSDTLQPSGTMPAFSVLSSSATQTQLKLDSMEAISSVLDNGGAAQTGTDDLVLGLQAMSGYRITGFSLAGTLGGELAVGQAPAGATITTAGSAQNNATIGMGLFAAGSSDTDGSRNWFQMQLNDDQAFDFQLDNVHARDALELHLNTRMFASAQPTAWSDPTCSACTTASFARMNLVNPVLTIYTEALAAVPEPSSWAMLAGGLGLLGGVARRRRG